MARPLAALALLLPATVAAGVLAPAGLTASSTYPRENGVSYTVQNLVDNRVGGVWIEGERSSGLGSSVTVDLGGARQVRGVRLWNGNQASTDFFTRHNRMKDVELTLSDGSRYPFTLHDSQAAETLLLPKPVSSTSVKLKFTSVYAGSTFGDTCLAELQVLDDAPDPFWAPTTFRASSTYPADASAPYDANLVADGMIDTMWCEGNPKGDGTGEWLELDLGATRDVSRLRVFNGNAASAEDNAVGSQPSALLLSFDDGRSEQVALRAGADAQDLSFAAHSSRKIRVSVAGVARGTEYPDVCISELQFSE